MRIRIKFTKNLSVKYLGHLDIMRTFQRCFHRAGVKMTYSEGFNPHQKMSFALPLGVGITSKGEYMDAVIADGQDLRTIRRNLQAVTGDGFDVTDIRELQLDADNAMASVQTAGYIIEFQDQEAPDPGQYMSQPQILLQKKTKTGIRDVDIKKAVLSVSKDKNYLKILMCAAGEHTIKPELVVQDMLSFYGTDYNRDFVEIIREELYARDQVPLIEYQTIITP